MALLESFLRHYGTLLQNLTFWVTLCYKRNIIYVSNRDCCSNERGAYGKWF